MVNLENYFNVLEILFNALPFVFWKDKDGKYQGGNLNQAHAFGFSSPTEFIGKTIYEILTDYESAKKVDEIDTKIMADGVVQIVEEKVVTPYGEKVYLSQKQPIVDEDHNVIGLIGFAMDITQIKLQQDLAKQEREKLIKVADQVAHDIRSPAASLEMFTKTCDMLPEDDRINLREIATSITDIANNLLNQYKSRDYNNTGTEDQRLILVSSSLAQIIADKRYQYKNLPIKFQLEVDPKSFFVFIKAQSSYFKRMVSNIINNSVDAMESHEGNITIKLEGKNNSVNIIITDNGKGMSPEILNKVSKNIAFTEGKKAGHGIGLSQVRETLLNNDGKIEITSGLGKGTTTTLTFPRAAKADWIADLISIKKDDIIVIIDDDISIHRAWDLRMKEIISKAPSLQIKHYTIGQEALDFINNLSKYEKSKLFLLTDFELLKQNIDGLEIIKKSGISRSILVTSHYKDKSIIEKSRKLVTKILPKQLASEVPIIIDKEISKKTEFKKVEVVILDDDKLFLSMFTKYYSHMKTIDSYSDPMLFLDNINKYNKNTIILLDNNFKEFQDINGIQLAADLHSRGFSSLYLLSGTKFNSTQLPEYLVPILKTDINNISMIFSNNS